MEYTKDVRIKNLTLRDIHVGDWVQVWSETAERYSPPLKIIQICDDGTIYLVTSDEERPTPWEENIKNVDALPFTFEILRGFGFEVVENDCHKDKYRVYYKGIYLFEIRKFDRGYGFSNSINYIRSFKEFIDNLGVFLPEILNIEWKGLDKQT